MPAKKSTSKKSTAKRAKTTKKTVVKSKSAIDSLAQRDVYAGLIGVALGICVGLALWGVNL